MGISMTNNNELEIEENLYTQLKDFVIGHRISGRLNNTTDYGDQQYYKFGAPLAYGVDDYGDDKEKIPLGNENTNDPDNDANDPVITVNGPNAPNIPSNNPFPTEIKL